jgi:multicomponent K+:H+ antiporter subunit A
MESAMFWVWLPMLALFGSTLPGPLQRRWRIDPSVTAGAITLFGLGLLLPTGPGIVWDGLSFVWGVPWVPALGLTVSLRLDALGYLMALLILGIGLLVVVYAKYYLAPDQRTGRFFGPLLAFMGAMLGIALSENLLLLVVFWELTSITSFLLISFSQHKVEARRGARMALVITGLGGLALLAAVVLVGQLVGSYELTTVLAQGDLIRGSTQYPVILGLVLLGAFTKSAQVPFHFWLPHAMSAPTPVSAYLHSATMVKAGLFLLARLYPILSGTSEWFVVVTTIGLVTMVAGAFVALFQHDLKGLLAYSTISHLGLITMLLGLSTAYSPAAALFHLVNHAVFKASLFMAAGIIDHETGTRDLRRLGGLRHAMPFTATLAIVASAAMAGVPLLNGFLSKEMFFAETLDARVLLGAPWFLPAAATLGASFSVAYSARFIHDVFFGPVTTQLDRVPHEPSRWMRVPVELLVLLCIAIGVAPAVLVGDLIHAAADAMVQGTIAAHTIAIWHGFNIPLLMSATALAGGAAIFAIRAPLFRFAAERANRSEGQAMFDAVQGTLVGAARRLDAALHTSWLHVHLRWFLVAVLAVAGLQLVPAFPWHALDHSRPGPVPVALLAGVVVAVIGVVRTSGQPLTAIIVLGVAGLVVTLSFAWVSAPDLALTQLLVELVAILLLLVALPHFGTPPIDRRRLPGRAFDAVLSLGVGAFAMLGSWLLLSTDTSSISRYFLENSVTLAEGANVVNVILVDFRGFDTFGEVTVLAIASIGVLGLLDDLSRVRAPGRLSATTPLLLQTVGKVLLNLALVTAVFLFLRGHNAPGGGFIAGLTAAVGFIFVYQVRSPTGDPVRRPASMVRWLAIGVALVAVPGIGATLLGKPFLTAGALHLTLPLVGELHLSSVMLFDLGVLVVVVAAVMAMLPTIGRIPMDDHYHAEREG